MSEPYIKTANANPHPLFDRKTNRESSMVMDATHRLVGRVLQPWWRITEAILKPFQIKEFGFNRSAGTDGLYPNQRGLSPVSTSCCVVVLVIVIAIRMAYMSLGQFV